MKKLFWIVLTSICLFSCGSGKTEKNSTQVQPPDTVPQTVVIIDSFPSYTEGEIKWGEITNGLQMGLAAKGDTIFFYYKNCNKKDVCIWTHTTGYGLSWNSVELISNSGDTTKMEFDVGTRYQPGISETVCIKAGSITAVKECLQEWITFRAGQQQIPGLEDGKYMLLGFYHGDRLPQDPVPQEHKKTVHWSGKLNAPSLVFTYKKRITTNNQLKATLN
ncbi:MAG: hypothetical protein IAF38_11475 [Bacteroidia bacterium]|nr:hypothetical protein [Bacteroidia bacterium]